MPGRVKGQAVNRDGWSNAPFDLSYRSRTEKIAVSTILWLTPLFHFAIMYLTIKTMFIRLIVHFGSCFTWNIVKKLAHVSRETS